MTAWSTILPGFEIHSDAIRSSDRVTFQAIRLADGKPVMIDTLEGQYPDPHKAAQLKREAEIASRLSDLQGVLNIYDNIPYGQGNLAIVRDPLQITLAEYLREQPDNRLPLPLVISIGITLAQTLGAVHDRGIVHKAVTPHHIFIEPESHTAYLSRFAIASELLQERQSQQAAKRLEGPLPYMSPEQSGRMNRDLDYRSDYYSLGVTLYEMVTSRLPFEADSVLEWVHQHISQQPPEPNQFNQDIPQALSAVILKLLAKNPEQRYQSASGLIADLETCEMAIRDEAARDGAIHNGAARYGVVHNKENADTHFEAGRYDISGIFLTPQKLYGREAEQQHLLEIFKESQQDQVELCLVHGYSGVGKSALIREFALPVEAQSGFLIQAKFDQFNQSSPYLGLGIALRGLMQQIFGASETQLEQWRINLQHALGPNAQLIIDLVPELERLIGKQAPVQPLPASESRNRFQTVLTQFVRVFAQQAHPLVLFLDDLQWSDRPTLDILKALVSNHEGMHLFIIGAYRNNEVGEGHPLNLMIEELKQVKTLHEVALSPLSESAIQAMVNDTLPLPSDEADALNALLYRQAKGNPFFTVELMKSLHQSQAIFWHREAQCWGWQPDLISWSTLPEDVVQFVTGNLRLLPQQTQEVLQLAACIGSTFTLQTLAMISEKSAKETARALQTALENHLIVPLNSDYKLVESGLEVSTQDLSYQFSHDRVQQAAYALIEPDQKPQVHLSIGRLLWQSFALRHGKKQSNGNEYRYSDKHRYSDEQQDGDEQLINIVGHLNLGRSQITDTREQLELAQLNLRAATKLRATAAYTMALEMLQVAEALLPNDAWSRHFKLKMQLSAEMQQCLYLTGQLHQADAMMDLLLRQAKTDYSRAEFLAIRTRQYATLGKMTESIESAIRGLHLLGFDFSTQPTLEQIKQERQLINEGLAGRKIADIVHAAPVTDKSALLAGKLLTEIFAASFLSASGNLFPYLVLKAVNLSLRTGNSHEAAFAYIGFGMLLCGDLDEQALGFEYGKLGLAINEKLGESELSTRIVYVYAVFIHHWNSHWKTLTPLFREGIKLGYQSGDLLYLADSAQDCVLWDPTLDLKTLAKQHADNMAIVHETGYLDAIDSGALYSQLIQNFRGQTDSPISLSDASFDEERCLRDLKARQFVTGIANYHIFKVEAAFLHGDYAQALKHIYEQDKLIKSSMALPQLTRFYITAFLTLAESFTDIQEKDKEAVLARLRKDLKRMSHWADNCKDNFLHLERLMIAELAQLEDPNGIHIKLFEAAISAAKDSSFIRDEAVACERAARHMLKQGLDHGAEGYLRAAYHTYKRWGATRKITLLEQEFPLLKALAKTQTEQGQAAIPTQGYSSIESGSVDNSTLDMASVMKASRAISKEMVVSKLLQNILDILLENAGGQWGGFVVNTDAGLVLKALKGHQPNTADDAIKEGLQNTTTLLFENQEIPLSVNVIEQVLKQEKPIVIQNATQDKSFAQDPYILQYQPGSIICVPVQRGNIQGAVYMENNLATDVFSEARIEVLSLLTAQAVVALENAELYEQLQHYSHTLEEQVAVRTAQLEELNQELKQLADTDGLTGLANRRSFDRYLQKVWHRSIRANESLAIILFDVDHFKRFNDTYGHQLGDDCLIEIANAVKAQIQRQTDMIARYGGEEFVVLLPDTDEKGALIVAEALRAAVQALHIPHSQSPVCDHVTISLGVATASSDNVNQAAELKPEQIVANADQALYQSKESGRNQVSSALTEYPS